MTTRSAGFTTVSMNTLSPGSQWTYILLMFIGGSPSSTAGGIRTTTLVIAIAAIVSFIRGKKEVTLFHRTIPQTKVRGSFIVIITGVAVVCLFAILIYLTSTFANNDASTGNTFMVTGTNGVLETFFEAASAIGTVGASMGLTPTINDFGLVLLMLLMFIGYLGISSTLLS
jgi:Trk-type K+ transport system membrane component